MAGQYDCSVLVFPADCENRLRDSVKNADHKSPFLRQKERPQKSWFTLYVLGSGFVTGWKRLAIATAWGVLMCILMDKWIETDYPSIFPVSTLPFTIATFILGPMLALFINYNSTKFVDSMKFYKKANEKAVGIASAYASGMRLPVSGRVIDDIRDIVSSLCFAMKHELRKQSTLRSAPLYKVYPSNYNDDSSSYYNLTPEQTNSLKQQQNDLNKWACERGISGAKFDHSTGQYVMSGLQVSKLPWSYELRIEALNLKICNSTQIISLLYTKIDNSAPAAGITASIVNAVMAQISGILDVFADVKHLRNTRVPVVVSNILYLGIVLYLMFLPLAFWDFFRWFTLLPYLLIAFFMLGLLGATEQLANPFGRFQTSNAIYRDIGRRARVGHRDAWCAFNVAFKASTDISRRKAANPALQKK